MGRFTPTDRERAAVLASGTLNAVGAGPWVSLAEVTNLWVTGPFAGSAEIDMSFDGGTTVLPVLDDYGVPRQIIVPQRLVIAEREPGVVYRLRCTARSAGAIGWRFSA